MQPPNDEKCNFGIFNGFSLQGVISEAALSTHHTILRWTNVFVTLLSFPKSRWRGTLNRSSVFTLLCFPGWSLLTSFPRLKRPNGSKYVQQFNPPKKQTKKQHKQRFIIVEEGEERTSHQILGSRDETICTVFTEKEQKPANSSTEGAALISPTHWYVELAPSVFPDPSTTV